MSPGRTARRQRNLIKFVMRQPHDTAWGDLMALIVQVRALIVQVSEAMCPDDATNEVVTSFTPFIGERTMILEVRHLRILTAIADHGTVSAATKHVYLTQSAISHQLIELEQRLGLPFFHRTPKGMVPTEAGTEMIEVARDVLARLAAAEASVLRSSPRSTGRLRVGTDSSLALAWLPAAVGIVRRRLPHIRAELVPDTTAHGVDALFEGRYELAVVADAPADPRLDIIPLFDEELIAAVAPTHRLSDRATLAPGDLRVEQLAIHASRPSEHRWLTERLAAASLEPMRLTTVMLTEALVGLAEAGEAVAIVPRTAAEPAARAGRVRMLRIGTHGLRRRWQLVTLATGVSALHVQCFASAVQQVAAADAAGNPRETSAPTPRVPKSA
jgi:LysR family transcriptional regulator for metE and metH